MSRRKKRKSGEEVELNLAAMLDMAFQLLTFFILTFKPAPVEGQVNLRLPPPVGITRAGGDAAGTDFNAKEPPKGMTTLVVSVFSQKDGSIAQLAVGETPVGNVLALDNKLQTVFADKSTPFDQVIVYVGPDLRYDELMRVIEVCTRQKLPDGSRLSKLSFVEMPPSG
jgi:biopolymer transport protein ExbD